LDMSHAARMERAKEMGFHPVPVYHGTAEAFDSFDLTKGGLTSGSRAGGVGVSSSPNSAVANEFASIAADKTGGNPSVMKMMIRPGRTASVELQGSEKNLEVAATLENAFSQGYDTVVLRNYHTPNGAAGQTVLVGKNPNQYRSVSADFDPSKIHSPNLLAANGGKGGAATGAAVNAPQDHDGSSPQDPGMIDILRKYGLHGLLGGQFSQPDTPWQAKAKPGDA
ncbi:MAG: hypothetical protein ABL893_20215, partial [Hyphomicrobium sp.]